MSVGPDGRVVTGPDGKPEYVKFEVTLPTYTSSFLSLQLSNDNFENNPRINQELLQYLLNHPGKHVYDWDLIPDEVVVSGYTNASIKKYYERALRDAKDEEHRSIYRSILSN